MKRLVIVLASAVAMFGAFAGTASAATRPAAPPRVVQHVNTPFDLTNVHLNNNVGWIGFHGLHNDVTLDQGPGSTMTQFGCGSYFVDGSWNTACQWKNGSSLCMQASPTDGVVTAEVCSSGYRPQLWITVEGPNQNPNPYWFWNVYWSQHNGQLGYLNPVEDQLGSALSGDFLNTECTDCAWLVTA